MKKCLLLTMLIAQIVLLHAQQLTPQLICSGSGSMTNGTSNISWTLGETVIATMTAPSYLITSGFSQPDFRITAVHNNISQIDVKLFPNPAKDFLTLQTKNTQLKNATYALFDLSGKIISAAKISDENMLIDFSNLTSATYLLNILDTSNQIIQSYKIVKQ